MQKIEFTKSFKIYDIILTYFFICCLETYKRKGKNCDIMEYSECVLGGGK